MDRLHRVSDALVTASIAILAIHVLLLLFTGGYRIPGLGAVRSAAEISPSLVLLLALLVLRGFLARRSLSWEAVLAPHPFFLFCLVLLAYLANGMTLSTPDTVPARCLPWSLLTGQGFTLDAFPALHGGNPAAPPYFLHYLNGHWISDYPVGAAVLALPFYLPSVLGGADPAGRILIDLEKLAAAVITALSAVVVYWTVRRERAPRVALGISFVYALATSSLSVSSQALWQHGPSQLALAVALYCLARAKVEPAWAGWAGFALGVAIVCRPMDLLIALPLAGYVLWLHRTLWWRFLVSGLPPLLFQLWYNLHYFGDPLRTQFSVLGIWSAPLLDGLAGILLSPGRGLLIYSPVLLFSFVGMGMVWRKNGDPLMRTASIGVVLTILCYGKYHTWWGGWTFGPRLLADLTPLLALLLMPVVDRIPRSRKLLVGVVVLTLCSIGAHAIGTTQRAPYWNADVDGGRFPQHLWMWTDNQIVNPLRDLIADWRIAAHGLPTSATAPRALSAAYRTDLPTVLTVARGTSIRLRLPAQNRGDAVWLARPTDGRGAVRMDWRWIAGEGRSPIPGGRMGLRYDIFPGGTYEFSTTISVPAEPGRYLIEIGLVSERVAWFSDVGSPPFRLSVEVGGGSP